MSKFYVGQKVLRLMGDLAGYWPGEVIAVDGDDVLVRVDDIGMRFRADEYLVAADDPSVPSRIEDSLRKAEEASKVVDTPLWPTGYFGDLESAK